MQLSNTMSSSKFVVMVLVVIFGTITYTIIGITFTYGWHRSFFYDPMFMEVVDLRPRNTYLREPRRLLDRMCDNTTCLKGKSVNWTMVTFIKSKVNYFKRREFLRRTWSAINYFNGAKFETVFLMGRTSNIYDKALLDEEEDRYSDILQFDGPDDYRSMPYKVLAGMEWASMHLDENTLYASADDDFLINLEILAENVTSILQNCQLEASYNTSSNTDYNLAIPIMCMFVKGKSERPMRKAGKWRVTYREYKREIYPPYCHGGMYVMSLPVATNLWNESRTAPMLRLDDVWITGILRRRINFPDDLVYEMPPKTTKHFGTINDGVRKAMDEGWMELEKSFENDTLCKCTL